MPYVTRQELHNFCPISKDDLDECERLHPGFIDQQLINKSAIIDARLRKRYAAPFVQPYPVPVQEWLGTLVTIPIYHKIGIRPSDEQYESIVAERDKADKDITEAANSKDGLFDLPERANSTTTGIVQPDFVALHQHSPYVWMDLQRDRTSGNL